MKSSLGYLLHFRGTNRGLNQGITAPGPGGHPLVNRGDTPYFRPGNWGLNQGITAPGPGGSPCNLRT